MMICYKIHINERYYVSIRYKHQKLRIKVKVLSPQINLLS